MKSSTEPGQQTNNPLGERVVPAVPAKKEWMPVPGKPSLEQNKQGQVRTNIPSNGAARYIPC
jgi:hypothetical protein